MCANIINSISRKRKCPLFIWQYVPNSWPCSATITCLACLVNRQPQWRILRSNLKALAAAVVCCWTPLCSRLTAHEALSAAREPVATGIRSQCGCCGDTAGAMTAGTCVSTRHTGRAGPPCGSWHAGCGHCCVQMPCRTHHSWMGGPWGVVSGASCVRAGHYRRSGSSGKCSDPVHEASHCNGVLATGLLSPGPSRTASSWSLRAWPSLCWMPAWQSHLWFKQQIGSCQQSRPAVGTMSYFTHTVNVYASNNRAFRFQLLIKEIRITHRFL